ncbi:hypothetical protein [Methanobrevibacter curvatus]|uniref:Uncharacterized protein n=1 Tax=Methanobrevibacter curvatus TaxID=49547 RepID=A0A166B284_9EURY|nr:hypothetical protein [Methanobrevibacter curvatus]KZX12773.1 hypothetical protein MBCUR_09150 [Methanobrevibacter curvatus]
MSSEILTALLGIFGVIIGVILTSFEKSSQTFKNSVKKYISLKKDIEQLESYPLLNHIICDKKMYNDILNLLKYYYFFKKTDLLKLDIDIDLLILIKDLILYIEKSFIYFSYTKYPLRYPIENRNEYTGEIELSEENKEDSNFKKGTLVDYYRNTFFNDCENANNLVDTNLIESMQKMNDIIAHLKKYEKFNKQNHFCSYLENKLNKKTENINEDLINDMKNQLNKNPLYKNPFYIENYEMFFMYLNFSPKISFCKIKKGIIFMKTDSSYPIEEVSSDVFSYILELKEFLAYSGEQLIPNIYYYYSPTDNELKKYKATGYLNIIITNLTEQEWASIDTKEIFHC